MINFNQQPYTAKAYIDYLTKQFGTNRQNDSRTFMASDEVWQAWEKQGVSKPSNNKDFDTAIHNPLDLTQQYFNDIIISSKNLRNYDPKKTIFHIFPWSEFNAAANTLIDDERVILFDSSLTSFFNAISIIIMQCVYSHPSAQQAEFYETMVLSEFDKFIHKKVPVSTKDRHQFATNFQKIVMQDYDLTYAGASCAVALDCFVLCHEIAHFVLEHSQKKHCLNYALSNGKSVSFEIDSINQRQEFEADEYGYQLFLQLIENNQKTKRVKLSESYQLMPLIFFEIIDLVFAYARSKNINFYEKNTHPAPLERKEKLINFIDGKHHPFANEFYEAFMDFSKHVRSRF